MQYHFMRLVLDTDVMVSALRSDAGASRRVLVAALRGQFTLLLTVPLMIEYEAVMLRREHLLRASLSTADVEDLLSAIAKIGEKVRLSFLWRPMLDDPNDDMVLEAAINGRADALLTFNRRDFGSAADRFGIRVLSPGEGLVLLSSQLN